MNNYIENWAKIVNSIDEIENFKSKYLNESADDFPFKPTQITDKSQIIKILPDVLEMVVSSYKNGYKGNTNLEKLEQSTPLIKIVHDNHNNLLACSLYRRLSGAGGLKVTGVGTNRTGDGKLALQEIIKTDIHPYTNWIWAEVSGAIEHYFKKLNGYPLPNEYAVISLEKKAEKIDLLDDGFHYRRLIGQPGKFNQPDTKVIFGFKNKEIAEKVFAQSNYEMRRKNFNSELLEDDEHEPQEYHRAVSFVNQLSDLYDEENFRTLPPGLSSELDQSIEILTKYVNYEPYVKDILDNAVSLRKFMPEIRIL